MDASNRTYRILLVEDHAEVGALTAAMLRSGGHDVELVRSGNEALERAEAANHDLVICDLNLPDISGPDLARRLRANGSRSVLVALSGFDAQTVARMSDGAFDVHLTKPLDWDVLQEQLVRLNSAESS